MAAGASKTDLFWNRIHLFTGVALNIVALNKNSKNWEELVDEITMFCMGSTSDCDLLRTIQERKQEVEENFAVYITQMEMMFQGLRQPLPEVDICDIVIRGLRAPIMNALAGNNQLRTLHELRSAA